MVLQDCGFASLRKLLALAEAVSVLLATSKTSTKKKRTFPVPTNFKLGSLSKCCFFYPTQKFIYLKSKHLFLKIQINNT